MPEVKRPALRYHGGKWAIADWVIGFFPEHRTYVEPFGGGASILLSKPRSHIEIYNELDGEVVNYFAVLRDPQMAAALRAAVSLTPYARAEFLAAKPNSTDGPVERARKMVIRSYMGFAAEALYRRPNENAFRTPSHLAGEDIAKQFAGWPTHIPTLTQRLRGVTIENQDAKVVIEKYDRPDALFYLDPPYVFSTRDATAENRQMYPHEMTDAQHRELATVARAAQGFVVLSGYDCELYSELYGDWRKYQRNAHTNKNAVKTETVWLNPAAASVAQPSLL